VKTPTRLHCLDPWLALNMTIEKVWFAAMAEVQ
jgi:hypothetical protein